MNRIDVFLMQTISACLALLHPTTVLKVVYFSSALYITFLITLTLLQGQVIGSSVVSLAAYENPVVSGGVAIFFMFYASAFILFFDELPANERTHTEPDANSRPSRFNRYVRFAILALVPATFLLHMLFGTFIGWLFDGIFLVLLLLILYTEHHCSHTLQKARMQ